MTFGTRRWWGCQPHAKAAFTPGMCLVLIFTRGWVDPRAMERSEGDMSLKKPVTPPGIDPGTVRLVAQHLNYYATPGPAANGTGIISRLPSTNKWHPLNHVPEDGRCQGRCRWMQGLCATKLQSSGNNKREIWTAPTPSSTASADLLFLFATAAQYEDWSRTLQRFSKSLLCAPASCFENFRFECLTTDRLSCCSS
jgi:hypothetical protein